MNNLLDNHTLEQIEVMAQCVWQHEITKMSVMAIAMFGDGSKDKPQGDQEIPEHQGPTIGWEKAKGRMNLARRRPDGKLELVRQKLTPEQDQARKLRAVDALLGVQAGVANPSANSADKMRAQLNSAPKPGGTGG